MRKYSNTSDTSDSLAGDSENEEPLFSKGIFSIEKLKLSSPENFLLFNRLINYILNKIFKIIKSTYFFLIVALGQSHE